MVERVDPQSECKEKVAQGLSWPKSRRCCYCHVPGYTKRKVASRKDCEGVPRKRQQSAPCRSSSWEDCAAETNCETLPLGALLNVEWRYKKEMHCFKSWTFHSKHCICLRFCWYFISRRGGCCEELNGCPVALFVPAHFRPRARGFCSLCQFSTILYTSEMRLNCWCSYESSGLMTDQ